MFLTQFLQTKKQFNMRNLNALLVFLLVSTVLFSQEEPEAKFLKNKTDFLDSIPVVMVNASEPQWTISKYLTGSHFVYAVENDSLYKDIRIEKWMKDSKTAIIRWPGGTVVQLYHWDSLTGIPFRNDSWDPKYDGATVAGYNYMDLDEYIAYCRRVNAEPMVGVNIKSGKEFKMHERSIDEAKRLIEYCKQKEYNVKFWYIGNEGYAKGFSPLEYAKYIDIYAGVLKSVDPDITIIGDWKMGPYKKNRFQESIDIARASKTIDVMEFHEKWGNIWGLKSGYTMEEWRNQLPIYDGKLTTLIGRFKEEMKKDNRNIKIGFNEWGLGGIKDGTKFDHALIASDFMIEMFKNNVYQACYWNLNIGDKNTRVIEANAKGNELIALNPIAKIFTMFSDAQNKKYVHLDSTDEHIYGFGAKDEETGELIVYVLNKSTAKTPINLAVFRSDFKEVTMKIESFINPGIIITSTLKNSNSNKTEVNLEPFSLSKITISKF